MGHRAWDMEIITMPNAECPMPNAQCRMPNAQLIQNPYERYS